MKLIKEGLYWAIGWTCMSIAMIFVGQISHGSIYAYIAVILSALAAFDLVAYFRQWNWN
jgi:hypothetical protein